MNTNFSATGQVWVGFLLSTVLLTGLGYIQTAQAIDINIGQSAAPSVAISSPTLTKPTVAEVKAFVAKANALAKSRNLSGYTPMIASDMRFELNMNGQLVRGGKNDYMKLIQQGMAQAVHYQYQSKTESIAYRGPQVLVQSLIQEHIEYGSDRPAFDSVSREVAVIEKRNGQLYLTELRANTNLVSTGGETPGGSINDEPDGGSGEDSAVSDDKNAGPTQQLREEDLVPVVGDGT